MDNGLNKIFSYEDMYSYNDESILFENCILKVDLGELKAGTAFSEIIVNLKTNKIKMNLDSTIYVVDFDVTPSVSSITVKINDSDFEDESDDDDSC